jgi:hypothetical protein
MIPSSGIDIEQMFGLLSGHCEHPFCRPIARGDARRPRKGTFEMAMIRVAPVSVHVRTDWFDGRPREISWGDRKLSVTRLAAVRDETSAYPVVVGPRTVFEVDTPLARVTLSYRHRTRRWTIEGVDEEARSVA